MGCLRKSFLPIWIFLIWIGIASCGLSSSTTSGLDSETESLDDQQSQLFSDGPVEMGAGIAKLQSPDLDKITVTVSDIAESVSSRMATTNGGTAFAEADKNFSIEGSAGAIADVSSTPKVLIFNATRDTQVITTVEEDGSFSDAIDGELSDTLVFASMTDSEEEVSPPLTVKVDENGIVAISTTNSATINPYQDLMSDGNGYHYFSFLYMEDDPPTATIVRQRIDGTEPQIIASGLSSKPLVVLASDDDTVTFILGDGRIFTATISTSGSVSATLQLVGSGPALAETTIWDVTSLDTVSGGLPTPEQAAEKQMSTWGYTLVRSSDGRALFVTYPYKNPTTNEINPYLLRVYYDDGTVADELPTSTYDNFIVDMGQNDRLYAAYSEVGSDTTDFVRFFMPTTANELDFDEAWNNKITLFDDINVNAQSIDAATSNDVVVSDYDNARQVGELVYLASGTADPVQITDSTVDHTHYENAIISPDGDFILFCNVDYYGESEVGSVSYGQLMLFIPDQMTTGEAEPLVTGSNYSTCTGNSTSYFIDSENRVHFYMNYDDDSVQHGIIIPELHPQLKELF